MKTRRIGIIMNGVTGRMGTNQHLIRSIKAIRDQGGDYLFTIKANQPRLMADVAVAFGDAFPPGADHRARRSAALTGRLGRPAA